jgi:hypothetical protein
MQRILIFQQLRAIFAGLDRKCWASSTALAALRGHSFSAPETFGTQGNCRRFSGEMRKNGYSDEDQVVAVGLLTRREVAEIGAQLSRLYPLDEENPFIDLLAAIDEADREYHRRDNLRCD